MPYNLSELETQLSRMDSIAGLEIKHSPIQPLWIETFRRIDGLYQELCIVRQNLFYHKELCNCIEETVSKILEQYKNNI